MDASYDDEYRLYLDGCRRLGEKAMDAAEFAQQWEEWRRHAEKLTEMADSAPGQAVSIEQRAAMLRRFRSDRLVRVVLAGMATDDATDSR
ncbi:MAG: hypothetical protein KGJ62_08665 [Armatimonadetes bacterium]|nr:hypothetical protein [Armatimonadota bacterium]MDE2205035.1 hypothetical protein [Armatimonadota bacterium]